ncbi:VanZ family protein [Lysinibacillus sp. 2017]|uniref:VanZ family protein n=1 Tax=unclassified Lysinibacillus TaxID=2636778 RepID=UPI000D527E33|nr:MULTISPECIES: VanZ family protein [unclassified Lysinibacillus]AWE06751.1 VanZ family protein [Lysinibacillus sp. 2017]TGN37317.1 VanZ family protein [Lysinibacillus sp. S2017]
MVKSLSWISVILLMILIFYFSQQPVIISNDLSTGITERIIVTVEMVAPIQGSVPIDTINHIVRKSAHFFIYFFLGIFVLIALKKSGVNRYRSARLALFFCMAYAVSDETHQFFVTGRGAQVKDVLIDSTGAATGIFIATIIASLIKNRTARSKKLPSKKPL